MSPSTDGIEEVLAVLGASSKTRREPIETTGPLDAEHRAELLAEWKGRFADAMTRAVAILGSPSRGTTTHRAWFGAWYPAALNAVAWEVPGGWLYVALEQADPASPITVAAGRVSAAEIDAP